MFIVLGWPSPDLNPIDNLWQDLKLYNRTVFVLQSETGETRFVQMCKTLVPHRESKVNVDSLDGYKQQQCPSAFISLNKFYFFKNN